MYMCINENERSNRMISVRLRFKQNLIILCICICIDTHIDMYICVYVYIHIGGVTQSVISYFAQKLLETAIKFCF